MEVLLIALQERKYTCRLLVISQISIDLTCLFLSPSSLNKKKIGAKVTLVSSLKGQLHRGHTNLAPKINLKRQHTCGLISLVNVRPEAN